MWVIQFLIVQINRVQIEKTCQIIQLKDLLQANVLLPPPRSNDRILQASKKYILFSFTIFVLSHKVIITLTVRKITFLFYYIFYHSGMHI